MACGQTRNGGQVHPSDASRVRHDITRSRARPIADLPIPPERNDARESHASRHQSVKTKGYNEIMYVLIYITAVAAANLSVAHFGPVSTPFNAFLLIGLDLAIRDRLHLDWRGRALWARMAGLIAGAGIISYLLNPASGIVSVASLVAFSAAAAASAVVFQSTRRYPVLARANGANVAGAALDSLIFPLIAFGTVFPTIAGLQFLAKVAGGAIWSWLVFRRARPA